MVCANDLAQIREMNRTAAGLAAIQVPQEASWTTAVCKNSRAHRAKGAEFRLNTPTTKMVSHSGQWIAENFYRKNFTRPVRAPAAACMPTGLSARRTKALGKNHPVSWASITKSKKTAASCPAI